MKVLITFCVAISLLFTSCTYYLSPYTSTTQAQTNFNEDQLKKVQFYLEGDITLYRDFGNSETEITSGEIKIVDGKKVEQIYIASGTPGVVMKAENKDTWLVSFEKDGSFLRFGVNNDYSGKYTLMAKDWDGRVGIIDYAGKEYRSTPESIYAYLAVNMEKINNTTVESKKAEGRTIDK
ncbi:MAG: hypothetical protein ACHQFW_02080 [Chitinophagales bacterium]